MSAEETLARWRAEEEAVRARLAAAAGYARPEQIRGRTGMEVFQGIFAGQLPRPPIGDTLDFVPIHIEPGLAVFQGRPQLKHYNPLGAVHGGWFATLLDSAVGCAVHSTLPAGKAYSGIEFAAGVSVSSSRGAFRPAALDAKTTCSSPLVSSVRKPIA